MLLELLRNRTSIRNFTGEGISMEVIKYILEAGRLSFIMYSILKNKYFMREVLLWSFNKQNI